MSNGLADFLSYITDFSSRIGNEPDNLEVRAPWVPGPNTPLPLTRQDTPEVLGSAEKPRKAPEVPTRINDFQVQDKAPLPQDLHDPTMQAALEFAMNPNLLASLLASETGGLAEPYQPDALSSAGAYGVSQIIPRWHYAKAGYEDQDLYQQDLISDPSFAIMEAARILDEYLTQYDSNIYDALSAYNAGPENIEAGRGYAADTLRRIGEDSLIP